MCCLLVHLSALLCCPLLPHSKSVCVYLCRVTVNPDPRPQAGQAIPITAYVLPNTAAVGTVQLTYLVNYGSPVTIPMTAAAGEEKQTTSQASCMGKLAGEIVDCLCSYPSWAC